MIMVVSTNDFRSHKIHTEIQIMHCTITEFMKCKKKMKCLCLICLEIFYSFWTHHDALKWNDLTMKAISYHMNLNVLDIKRGCLPIKNLK